MLETPPPRATLLLVDDTPAILQSLCELLAEDYDLLVVKDASSALELAAAHQPDLILLDVVMPGVNGYTIFRGRWEITLAVPFAKLPPLMPLWVEMARVVSGRRLSCSRTSVIRDEASGSRTLRAAAPRWACALQPTRPPFLRAPQSASRGLSSMYSAESGIGFKATNRQSVLFTNLLLLAILKENC